MKISYMIDGYWKIEIDGIIVQDWLGQDLWFETEEEAWNYVEEMQADGSVDPDTQHIQVYYYKRY